MQHYYAFKAIKFLLQELPTRKKFTNLKQNRFLIDHMVRFQSVN